MNYDTLRQLFEQIRDERRTAANTAQRIGVAFLSLLDSIRDICSGIFLRKDQPDTAQETITFQKGAEFGQFETGTSGAAMWKDDQQLWHCEADILHARMKMVAKELQIEEVTHIGGQQLLTAASMLCAFVVDKGTYYRCFFLKDDGNRKVKNKWMVGDQAYVRTFNIVNNNDGEADRFMWRLVVATSNDTTESLSSYTISGEEFDTSLYHFIDLSKVTGEYYTLSDAPQAGDHIVQLGFQGSGHPERQNAILEAGAGAESPYIRLYTGIDSFSLEGCLESQIKPGDNRFSGVVNMTLGSKIGDDYLSNLLSGLRTGVDNAQEAADNAQSSANTANTAAGNAQASADAAQASATAANNAINGLSTGNENLVVNGGFTGMYTSESVEDASFNADSEIYSEPFGKWPTHTGCSIVSRSASATGKACQMSSGRLEQTISRGITNGQPYTLSLLGLSTGEISVSIGGFSKTITLATGARSVEKFDASSTANTLVITGTGIITEIQLIEGNVKLNGWTPSPEDNNKYLGYYKNLAYLMEAMADGNTDIIGGLILTMMIRVGNHLNQQMVGETGGMSGIYNNDDDPFLWGGGTMTQALAAIRFFADDPMADPSEQLANMAKFVVTHGGRAILNDVILNNVYARGQINATSGKVGGFVIDGHALKNKRSGYNPSSSEPSTIDNTAYDPEAVIILENPAKGAYVSVGTNVLPPSLGGSRALVELLSSKDNYEQTDGVNLAMIVGATNALQNIAIAITGGCITNLAVKTAEYGWGTYVTSATDTTPALTRLIAKEACDVFATTEYNWRASDSGSYQKKTRNVYLTLPDMEMCDDGHIIKIKRGPNDGGEFHVIPGRSTYLVNGVPTWSQSVILSEHSDTWCYPTNDNSHDYRLYNEGRGCELVYHRDMTVTISGTTYHGVWIEHKLPRDW